MKQINEFGKYMESGLIIYMSFEIVHLATATRGLKSCPHIYIYYIDTQFLLQK